MDKDRVLARITTLNYEKIFLQVLLQLYKQWGLQKSKWTFVFFKTKWLVLYFSFSYSLSKTLLKAKVKNFLVIRNFENLLHFEKTLKSSIISIVVNSQMCMQPPQPLSLRYVRVTNLKSKAEPMEEALTVKRKYH